MDEDTMAVTAFGTGILFPVAAVTEAVPENGSVKAPGAVPWVQ